MADQWHYAVGGKQQGPVSVDALAGLAQTGGIMPQDLVWKEGLPNWVAAGNVPELFPQSASMPSPPDAPKSAGVGAYVPPASNLNYYNPAPAGAAYVYAGFWLRFVAWIIDYILVAVVQFAFNMVLGLATGGAFVGNRIRPNSLPMLSLTSGLGLTMLLLTWLYYALMESSPHRGTLGKIALGIVVTDMNGNTVTFGKATGRYFGRIISTILVGIGFIIAGFTQRKQALHDIMAGCLVVRKELPRQY